MTVAIQNFNSEPLKVNDYSSELREARDKFVQDKLSKEVKEGIFQLLIEVYQIYLMITEANLRKDAAILEIDAALATKLTNYENYLNTIWGGLADDPKMDDDPKNEKGIWHWKDGNGKVDPTMQKIIDLMKKNGLTMEEAGKGDVTIDEWLKTRGGETGHGINKADLMQLAKKLSNTSRQYTDINNRTHTDITQLSQQFNNYQSAIVKFLEGCFGINQGIIMAMPRS